MKEIILEKILVNTKRQAGKANEDLTENELTLRAMENACRLTVEACIDAVHDSDITHYNYLAVKHSLLKVHGRIK
jgi:hypothetical protein